MDRLVSHASRDAFRNCLKAVMFFCLLLYVYLSLLCLLRYSGTRKTFQIFNKACPFPTCDRQELLSTFQPHPAAQLISYPNPSHIHHDTPRTPQHPHGDDYGVRTIDALSCSSVGHPVRWAADCEQKHKQETELGWQSADLFRFTERNEV
jgi:hypothetical protein